MSIDSLMAYMSQYGMLFLFIIIFLEYLNLPGLAAGIIMPLAGIWVHQTGVNLIFALAISVMAGVAASWVLYFIGYYGGHYLIDKYINKFPKQKAYIDKKMEYLREKGNFGIFVSKLIPMARTITPIPAGVLKLNFLKYTAYSALGIFIWNAAFISAGYFIGEGVFRILA